MRLNTVDKHAITLTIEISVQRNLGPAPAPSLTHAANL